MPRHKTIVTAALAALVAAAPAVAQPGKPAKGDRDHDGLADKHELLAGTDPAKPDTDGDGVKDGKEGAGRVVARRGSRVVIQRFGGGAVRAKLTDATDVSCPVEDEPAEDEPAEDAPVEAEDGVELPELPAELQAFPEGEDAPAEEDVPAEDEEEEAEGCDADDLVRGTIVSESATAGKGARKRWTTIVLAD